jgi:hypothetical protein
MHKGVLPRGSALGADLSLASAARVGNGTGGFPAQSWRVAVRTRKNSDRTVKFSKRTRGTFSNGLEPTPDAVAALPRRRNRPGASSFRGAAGAGGDRPDRGRRVDRTRLQQFVITEGHPSDHALVMVEGAALSTVISGLSCIVATHCENMTPCGLPPPSDHIFVRRSASHGSCGLACARQQSRGG